MWLWFSCQGYGYAQLLQVMGNTRDKNRRLGVIRGGAIKRVKVIKQHHVQPWRREVQKISWQENVVLTNAQEIVDPFVLDCETKRVTKVILEMINNTLSSFSSILAKKVVLYRVLFDPIMVDIIPNLNVDLNNTLVEKELIYGLVQSLSEMKRPNNSMKLTTKHVILIVVVSDYSTTLFKHKV